MIPKRLVLVLSIYLLIRIFSCQVSQRNQLIYPITFLMVKGICQQQRFFLRGINPRIILKFMELGKRILNPIRLFQFQINQHSRLICSTFFLWMINIYLLRLIIQCLINQSIGVKLMVEELSICLLIMLLRRCSMCCSQLSLIEQFLVGRHICLLICLIIQWLMCCNQGMKLIIFHYFHWRKHICH